MRARLVLVRSAAVDWLAAKTTRERVLLAVLAALAAVALLFLGVWLPLSDARAQAIATIAQAEAVKAQLRAADPALLRRASMPRRKENLAAAAAKFGINIARLEPDGDRTRVVLQDAPYADLVRWLAEMERSGSRIGEVKLERRPPPGVVAAEITVVGG